MSKFKIGDRVTVVSRDYFRSGQTGTIVEIEDDSFTNPYFVDFDTPDPDMAQEAIEFYDEDARVAHRHYFELVTLR